MEFCFGWEPNFEFDNKTPPPLSLSLSLPSSLYLSSFPLSPYLSPPLSLTYTRSSLNYRLIDPAENTIRLFSKHILQALSKCSYSTWKQ